jgi:hypothetical protein
VIVAAGDIACDPTAPTFNGGAGTKQNCHQSLTADQVLAGKYDAVLALGDTQYECGDRSGYARAYDPSWGKFKAITEPVIGKSRVRQGLSPQRRQPVLLLLRFGGARPRRLLLLQHRHMARHRLELRMQLGQGVRRRRRLSAGQPPGNLAAVGLVSSHPKRFVVGTGGKNHYRFPAPPLTGEQVRNGDTCGILAMTLHRASYGWKFLAEPRHSFTDSGSGSCH